MVALLRKIWRWIKAQFSLKVTVKEPVQEVVLEVIPEVIPLKVDMARRMEEEYCIRQVLEDV